MGNVEVAGPHDVICEADIQSNRKAYSRQCWGLLVNLLHALRQYQKDYMLSVIIPLLFITRRQCLKRTLLLVLFSHGAL